MSDIDTDPVLRELLKLRADMDGLIAQESATPKVGTWTPAFANTGGGTPGVYTYTNQSGQYYLVGKIVFILARVTISAIGTFPVGATMSITGLPFTSSTRNNAISFSRISNFNYTAAALQLLGLIGGSVTAITLAESFDNSSVVNVPAANFTNISCDLILNGFYDLP